MNLQEYASGAELSPGPGCSAIGTATGSRRPGAPSAVQGPAGPQA